jgi:hypothetical protein
MNTFFSRLRGLARQFRGFLLARRETKKSRLERSRHFSMVARRIKLRSASGKCIRVGFFVLYDSAFPALSVARALVKDERFEPVIVLIPDTLRGQENMVAQLEKSHESLADLGIRVVRGYETDTEKYIDLSEELDFVCISNPYDELTHEYFKLSYLREKMVLLFFISYGFSLSLLHRTTIQREVFRNFWRVFVPTRLNRLDYREHANVLPGVVEVTGYPKMDDLARAKRSSSQRPSIILAPHHTVREWPGGLELSTFLVFAETILELPSRYPGIDFVFRPHPLLFVHLKADDLWGAARADQYLSDLAQHTNVTVDVNHEYLSTFARSDALIHDSGSFSAEYLFTGNPALFLSLPDRDPALQFAPLGQQCLSHHYQATSAQQIHEFIQGVVEDGDDPMKRSRLRFVNSTLKPHYPHASERVVRRLTSVLKRRTLL